MSLEEQFLSACKSGNLMLVMLTIQQKVAVNHNAGWGLRRAVRYNNPQVWRYLLAQEDIQVNLANESGQSALHTACRFNILEAVSDLLGHPNILLNKKSDLGSSPIMVAAKYCSKEAFGAVIEDKRADLETVDNQGRTIEEVVGNATNTANDDDKNLIVECLIKECEFRKKATESELFLENEKGPYLGRKEDMNFHNSEFQTLKRPDSVMSIFDEGYFTD